MKLIQDQLPNSGGIYLIKCLLQKSWRHEAAKVSGFLVMSELRKNPKPFFPSTLWNHLTKDIPNRLHLMDHVAPNRFPLISSALTIECERLHTKPSTAAFFTPLWFASRVLNQLPESWPRRAPCGRICRGRRCPGKRSADWQKKTRKRKRMYLA